MAAAEGRRPLLEAAEGRANFGSNNEQHGFWRCLFIRFWYFSHLFFGESNSAYFRNLRKLTKSIILVIFRGIWIFIENPSKSIIWPNSGVLRKSLSGVPDYRESGLPKVRISGLPKIRISGLPKNRTSENPEFRIAENPYFQKSGFSDYRKSRFPLAF